MNVLICGFGHAGQAYLKAISHICKNANVYVYDLNEGIAVPEYVNKLSNIDDDYVKFEVGIIATPPESHLSTLLLIQGLCEKIVIEKPISTSYLDYQRIKKLALNGNIYFSFHASFGKELCLFNDCNKFDHESDLMISHFFSDSYGDSKSHLGGPFWDSIYNVVSVFLRVVASDVNISKIERIEDNLDSFSSSIIYEGKNGRVINQIINIHWDKVINLKVTQVSQLNTNVTMNHSSQSCYSINGEFNLDVPFELDRLGEHYSSVLLDVINADDNSHNIEIESKISDLVWDIFNATLKDRDRMLLSLGSAELGTGVDIG